MLNLDELYKKNKERLKNRKQLFIAISAVVLAIVSAFMYQNFSQKMSLFGASFGGFILFLLFSALIIFSASTFIDANNREKSQKSKPFKLPKNIISDIELIGLEREREELSRLDKRASTISIICVLIAVVVILKFRVYIKESLIIDIFIAGFGLFGVARHALTYSKKHKFMTKFKLKILNNVAKNHELNYNPNLCVRLEDFLMMYDCRVDNYEGSDLFYGKIGDINVKFSDFWAKQESRQNNNTTQIITLFRGVIFVADFKKRITDIVQVRFKTSRYLARYGAPAVMDDARFREFFEVRASDQIAARYILTPTLMARITALYLKFNAPLNLLFLQNKIYISLETRKPSFEPDIHASLIKSSALDDFVSEIEGFIGISKQLDLG